MPLFLESTDAFRSEVYRRTMMARRNGTKSWRECLASATNTVMLEMDIWIMAPGAAI